MTSVMAENDIVEDGGYYVIIKLGKGFYWNTAKTKKEKGVAKTLNCCRGSAHIQHLF